MTIISRDFIRQKARRAFAAGQSRDSHCMNPGSEALVDWHAEYDRLDSERARDNSLELRRAIRTVKRTPPLHAAPAELAHADLRQGGAS